MTTFPKTRWLLVLCLAALLTPITHGQSPPEVTPREAGLSSTGLQQIDVLLQQAVERKQVAGAVALLARDGKIVYLRAKGFQDVEAGKEMTANTLFRIASMSKPVTSVAVMILVDDGRLAVTDPVSKYLPEFKNPKVLMPGSGGDSKLVPASREITIHDLLTHTSGLTYRFMAQKPFDDLYHKADICDGLTRPPFTLAENVRRLASLPLLHQPGSAFQYGLSTDVLGRLVEVISGQDLESFMRGRIFEPLGMNDTYFDLPTDKTSRLAVVYEPGADKRIRRVGEEPVHKEELVYCVTCPYRGQRGYCSGGAGLTSSAADYARFLQMLLNGGQWNGTRILKPETVREMTSNQIGDLTFMSPTDRFGYGFAIVAGSGKEQTAAVGSYAWGGFYNTGFWVDPEKKLVGVFMTQLYPADQPGLFGEFEKQAYAALQPPEQDQQVKRDIPYAESAHERQVLDVYSPHDAKNLPVVFWIHGGGWESGDKTSVQIKPQFFTDKGFVFVSTNYRLLPSVDMGTIVRDIARSIHWVHDHIAQYGGDPTRLLIMGHSAGAQLAALICTDERYLKAEGLPLAIIKGCVPVDGDTYDVPAIIETAETRNRVHSRPQPKFGHREKFGNDPEKHRDFSAVTHVTRDKGIPPFLLLYVAGHPDTSAQAQRLGNVLNDAGVPVTIFGAGETTHSKINENLGRPDDPATKALLEFLGKAPNR